MAANIWGLKHGGLSSLLVHACLQTAESTADRRTAEL